METKRLMATLRRQRWVNDYTVDESEEEFDATEAFLSLPLPEVLAYREHHYSSDGLAEFYDLDPDGPFEVDCDVNEWLKENGIEDRAKMTQEQLDGLRAKYGVNPAREEMA